MHTLTEEEIGMAMRFSKMPELAKLFSSEETEWRAIVLMQNSLDASDCTKYVHAVCEVAENMSQATIEQRVQSFIHIKLKR